MRKIIEYKLIKTATYSHRECDFVTKEVNDLIKQGYEPFGGLGVSKYYLYQALVKYDEVQEPEVYLEERRIRL